MQKLINLVIKKLNKYEKLRIIITKLKKRY